MDFQLSPEQQQLADAIARWAEKDYSFEHRRSVVHSSEGVRAEDWRALADLGLTALPLPQACGGFDGNAVDMMVVMQALGSALVIEPYFATMVAAECLRLAGGRDALLEQVAMGEVRMATAFGEALSRHDLDQVAVRATAEGEGQNKGYRITGRKSVVLHGAQADWLVVSARTSGDTGDRTGISLFLVEAAASGVRRTDMRTVDGMRAAEIELDVVVPESALIGGGASGSAASPAGWPLLEAVSDYAVTLLCAEAIGVMEALNAATLEHLRTRQQFGLPLGRQQALQHRMVDMFVQLEQARSLTMLAAMRMSTPDTDAHERTQACAAAKVQVSEALRFVGEQAVHLHGGIGVTDELPVAHLFKRATMISIAWGDAAHHLEKFAAASGKNSLA